MAPAPGTSGRQAAASECSRSCVRRGEEVDAVGCVAALQEFVENAELAKGPQSRAAKRDARAVGAPAGIDLDDIHVRARLAQLDGGGHA